MVYTLLTGPDDSKRIVYDAEAIDRLLDRSHLSADKEEPRSVADEYLSVFRVAHFDEAKDANPANSNASSDEPDSSAAASEQSNLVHQSTEVSCCRTSFFFSLIV